MLLIRHAHRDTSHGREIDNGLDEKGKKQAKKITEYYVERFGAEKAAIYSSRLTRCLETVEPLASRLGVKVQKSPLLIERWMDDPNETERQFSQRIRTFCDEWKESQTTLTIACSHGDWIPEALKYLISVSSDLKKGGWAEIQLKGNTPTLFFLLQKLP